MNNMVKTLVFLFATLQLLPLPANAQTSSGVVSGIIRIRDGRTDPYLQSNHVSSRSVPPPSGARQLNKFVDPSMSPASPYIPAPRILVELCVDINGGDCTLRYKARATESGTYSIPWSGNGSVTRLRVGAYPEWPDISTIWTSPTHPPNVFRVTTVGSPIVFLGYGPSVTTGMLGNRTIDVTYTATEYGNAYLTSAEVTLMHAAQSQPPSGSIVNDMKGVLISTLESNVPLMVAGGVTPRDDIIRLAPGITASNPFTLAHEWGHIVMWRSFDVEYALIGGPEYFNCDSVISPAWEDLSNECERASWMDGFAHMHAAMWMWTRTAPSPRIPRIFTTGTSMESHGSDQCEPNTQGHRRVMCQARGMWDIVDRPSGDEDTLMNRDLGSVIRVLRSFPRPCILPSDNGCVGEFGTNDMNWMDYRRNHINVFGDQVYLDFIGGLNDLLASNPT